MEYNTNMPIIYLRLTDAELAEIAPVLDDLALEIYKQRGKGHISRSEAAVLQWRRDNPNGIQADCIRAMAAQGLTLSRQYASDLWKIQLGASPMAWQEEGENEE